MTTPLLIERANIQYAMVRAYLAGDMELIKRLSQRLVEIIREMEFQG